MEFELYSVQCGDDNHELTIAQSSYFDEDEVEHVYIVPCAPIDPEIDVESLYKECLFLIVRLNPALGLFRRIKTAFEYVLGTRSIYGDFDEVAINKPIAKELINTLTTFVNKK